MCVCMLYPVLLVIYIDVGTIDVALAIGMPFTQHNSGVVICRCVDVFLGCAYAVLF